MSWIESKYVSLLSSQLESFRQKSPMLWNFRCPYCGDSSKNKNKTRGYIFFKSEKCFFHCHNCSETHTFANFLKYVNPALFQQYQLEKFSSSDDKKHTVQSITNRPVKQQDDDPLKALTPVSALSGDHSCKAYVVSRQIPTAHHTRLFYCERYMEWANQLVPGKFSENALRHDAPRLVLPFKTQKGELFGFQGRALNPQDEIRYITIMLDDKMHPLFGLEEVNLNQKFYVFEGPIDSLFIPNSLATTGGRMDVTLDQVDFPKGNAVLVYDNQPRNKDVIKNMLHAVRRGYKVCVWPSSLEEKDINDMILKDVKTANYVKYSEVDQAVVKISQTIDQHTFTGLMAELEITKWRKC